MWGTILSSSKGGGEVIRVGGFGRRAAAASSIGHASAHTQHTLTNRTGQRTRIHALGTPARTRLLTLHAPPHCDDASTQCDRHHHLGNQMMMLGRHHRQEEPQQEPQQRYPPASWPVSEEVAAAATQPRHAGQPQSPPWPYGGAAAAAGAGQRHWPAGPDAGATRGAPPPPATAVAWPYGASAPLGFVDPRSDPRVTPGAAGGEEDGAAATSGFALKSLMGAAAAACVATVTVSLALLGRAASAVWRVERGASADDEQAAMERLRYVTMADATLHKARQAGGSRKSAARAARRGSSWHDPTVPQ